MHQSAHIWCQRVSGPGSGLPESPPPRLADDDLEDAHKGGIKHPLIICVRPDNSTGDLSDIARWIASNTQKRRPKRTDLVSLVNALKVALVVHTSHGSGTPLRRVDARVTKRSANLRPRNPPCARELACQFRNRSIEKARSLQYVWACIGTHGNQVAGRPR